MARFIRIGDDHIINVDKISDISFFQYDVDEDVWALNINYGNNLSVTSKCGFEVIRDEYNALIEQLKAYIL